MVQKEFTDKLIALLNEYKANTAFLRVSGVAVSTIKNWMNSLMLNEEIDEVCSDYFDGEATVIDVWTHGLDEGESVARIFPDGEVEWTDTRFENCQKVLEEIKLVQETQSNI